ncbi:hypothetical protein KDI_01230 [Dictyobacter arantiisoli]|uniref:Uncharacterized protein n=1 Tax=Dictyobacter arantiisoli TaxID=2014874 RepID=A0A5A5T698_9CHLR|nr:hypothetical protein KDI_01230 [Dictyobacter arantiisoli]
MPQYMGRSKPDTMPEACFSILRNVAGIWLEGEETPHYSITFIEKF